MRPTMDDTPEGGADASNTTPPMRCVVLLSASMYCKTVPPIEWAMTTGGEVAGVVRVVR